MSEFNGTLFKGKRIEVSLKKRLQSPHLQDFESWNAIFTEKVKESGGCRTIVVRTFFFPLSSYYFPPYLYFIRLFNLLITSQVLKY